MHKYSTLSSAATARNQEGHQLQEIMDVVLDSERDWQSGKEYKVQLHYLHGLCVHSAKILDSKSIKLAPVHLHWEWLLVTEPL